MESLPFLDGLGQHVRVAFIDPHRLGGKIGPADLDDHVLDFRETTQHLFNALADFNRVGQRDARQLAGFDQD